MAEFEQIRLAFGLITCETKLPTFPMKPVITSSRLAVLLSCTAMVGATHAQAADKAEAAATPAAKSTPAAQPLALKDPVAVVNGEKISKAQLQEAFDNAVKMSGMDASKLTPEQQLAGYHKLLDDLITDKLLKAQAKDIKITDADVDKEIANIKKQFNGDENAFKQQLKQAGQTEDKLRELIKNGLAERKWIESQIADQVKIDDAAVEKFYKENIKEFEQPEMVRASHILFMVPEGAPDSEVKKKKAEAEAAYERAKKGEDFTKLAKELTEEPNGKERGGDLDYFSKDQMVPEFGQKAFSMKVGDISEPVKTQFGFHVIKVTGRKPAGTVPFDQVKPQLTNYLKSQKQQAAVHQIIDKLRGEAKIQNNLPEMKQPAPAAATPDMPAATPEDKTAQ
jgi:peptidyl-prolyl cis-trans isomerase C